MRMISSSNSHRAVRRSSKRCNGPFILIALQGDVDALLFSYFTTRSLAESFQIRAVFKTNCFNDDRFHFLFSQDRISLRTYKRESVLSEKKTATIYMNSGRKKIDATRTRERHLRPINVFENKVRSISGTPKNYDELVKVCRLADTQANIKTYT